MGVDSIPKPVHRLGADGQQAFAGRGRGAVCDQPVQQIARPAAGTPGYLPVVSISRGVVS